MGQNVRQEGKTIETFLEKRATESRVAVLSFNERLQVLQDFTSDRWLVQAVPKKAYLTSGGTYIYLSAAGAIEWLNAYAMTPGRRWAKILVVISDGFDNRSGADHRAAIEVALRSNVKIFTVAVPLLNQFRMLAAPGSAFIELCIKTSVKPLESRAKSGKKSERMTLTGLLMGPRHSPLKWRSDNRIPQRDTRVLSAAGFALAGIFFPPAGLIAAELALLLAIGEYLYDQVCS